MALSPTWLCYADPVGDNVVSEMDPVFRALWIQYCEEKEKVDDLKEALEAAEALIVRFICDDGPNDYFKTGLISDGQKWRLALDADERSALDRAEPGFFAHP